jgi:hypothetical protein
MYYKKAHKATRYIHAVPASTEHKAHIYLHTRGSYVILALNIV